MFEFLFQGVAAEHRSRAQCSILQRACLSEHPGCPCRRRANPCTQDRLCKQPRTKPSAEYHCSRYKAVGHVLIHVSSLSITESHQPAQAQQQPQAKPQPPARPPPPSVTPQAASAAPVNAPPTGPPTGNPPPMAPPSQAQGPPYPTYQGYPG